MRLDALLASGFLNERDEAIEDWEGRQPLRARCRSITVGWHTLGRVREGHKHKCGDSDRAAKTLVEESVIRKGLRDSGDGT